MVRTKDALKVPLVAAPRPLKRIDDELFAFAMSYPQAHEDHPWGERVVKVKAKVFVFFGRPGDGLHMTVKLPDSGAIALALPFVAPTGYGLGKAGWVSATFGPRDRPPVDVLKRWIDESYRVVAPRSLVAALPTAGAARQRSRSSRSARTRRKRSTARAR